MRHLLHTKTSRNKTTMFSSSSSTKRSTLAFFAMLFFICIASFASAARISPAMNENTNNIPSADSNGLIPRIRVPAPTTTGPASARLGASGNWFVHSSCIMEAPTIGEPQNMAKIESDVVKTVMHEFVYHNIKNLGFDESNVHVHASNGGHSDVVAIEWEIELVHKYQAEDTASYFNHLFQNENWHQHVTNWMSFQGQAAGLQAGELLKNLDEFELILPAHLDQKKNTAMDSASHSAEVQALIDKWLESEKPEANTITLFAGCSPLSSLTFQPTDFGAQVGASIITKSLSNDFKFDSAVEMEQTECGTFKTKILPNAGEEFGFYLFWKTNVTEIGSVSDIGCDGSDTNTCPPGDVIASLASCTNSVQNPGFVSHNRVFDGSTLNYNWGTCDSTCDKKPATCAASLGGPVKYKLTSHSPLGLMKTKMSSFASSPIAFIGAAVVAVVAVVAAYKAKFVRSGESSIAAAKSVQYGAVH